MTLSRTCVLAGLAALLAAPALALAQDAAKDRLSLTVRGKATAPADEVAIELTVSGSAEEATEAEKKYRDKLNRVLNALGKGDGKSTDDGESPRKRKKKPAKDDAAREKKKPAAEDEDEDAPKVKKKKPAAEDEDEDAPRVKKKKPAAEDEDEDAPGVRPKKGTDEDKADKPGKPEDKPGKPEDKKDEFPFVVEVKEGGLTFGIKGGDANQQRMRRMMGQQGGKEEPEFRFSSTLSLAFKSVAKADPKALRRRIAELLDRVSEAGVDTSVSQDGEGTPPVVRFAVGDAEELKVKAYAEAMTAARKRGSHLASLSERGLGRVVTVRDQTALPQTQHRPSYNPYQYQQYQVSTQLGEDWSTEVVVEVDLYVEFELKDGPAK